MTLQNKTLGNRYYIEEKIGSGGMAEVFRAHDNTLNRTVAVKVLYSHYAAEEGFVARFRREAQAAANLNHPNIVNIYDWGAEGSTYYIVMEYIIGRSLKEIIDEKAPLPTETIVDIGRQAAAALSHAHSHSLVHRDIKPHNIIITNEGKVKVTDFGIARSTTATMTQTHSILGTANYLSPEQAQGNEVGSVSDLYSLGVVLYEMATGQVPFKGESPIAIALKHIHEAPRRPGDLNPNLPDNLQAVIIKAIAKHPSDRYQNAEELREDLRRCAEGLSVAPVNTGGAETIVIPRVSAAAATAVAPTPTPAVKKRRFPIWAVVVILIIALLGGGVAGALYYINTNTVTVPKVVGLSRVQAKRLAARRKLRFLVSKKVFNSRVAAGKVIEQDPGFGEKTRKGSVIRVVLSLGRERVSVPKLTGITLDQATFFLAKSNLNVGDITKKYSSKAASGIVIGQDPDFGARVNKEADVDLIVSKGPFPIRVPDVSGKTLAEATALLTQKHLVINKIEEFSTTVDTGKVIRENPPPETIVKRGDTVTVVISKGPEKVTVPNVTGMNKNDAKSTLEDLGFTVQVETSISGPDDFDKVVNQDPGGGEKINKGASVTIWVGVSPGP